MFRKRLTFVVLALGTLASTLVLAEPAEAGRRGWGRGYRRHRYHGGSHYRYRRSHYRHSYGRSYYRHSYGRRYYRPRTFLALDFGFGYGPSYYDDYGYGYASYRRSYSRYRCGCGRRFASAYWLDYHYDHAHCDY